MVFFVEIYFNNGLIFCTRIMLLERNCKFLIINHIVWNGDKNNVVIIDLSRKKLNQLKFKY